jgi:hypothetical protein
MFCLVYVISDAQVVPKKIEGKPDYKETVEFIKSDIPNELFNKGLDGGYSPTKNVYYKRMYIIKELKFTDCVMEVRYVIEETLFAGKVYDPTIKSFSNVIDFNKVESISLVSVGETNCLIGLQFKIKGLNKKVAIELPITRIDCQQPIKWEELKDLKIFKAFNHLRKMCGAPEPVEF